MHRLLILTRQIALAFGADLLTRWIENLVLEGGVVAWLQGPLADEQVDLMPASILAMEPVQAIADVEGDLCCRLAGAKDTDTDASLTRE